MRKLPYILPLLLALLVAGCGKQESDLPVNTRLGGEFTLTDHNGEPFSQTQLKGKVSILFFGYTHCPDICPAVLARVAQVYRQLQEAGEADQVQPVFITFDPERDTAEHLKEYLPWFKADIIGLTGSLAEIREVRPAFYFSEVTPAPVRVGVAEPMMFVTWDNVLVAGAHVPDEQVQSLLAVLFDEREAIGAAYPPLNALNLETAFKEFPGVDYHPGAVAFFEDRGVEMTSDQ